MAWIEMPDTFLHISIDANDRPRNKTLTLQMSRRLIALSGVSAMSLRLDNAYRVATTVILRGGDPMGARIDFASAWELQSVSDAARIFLRLSLGASFLSAVADRFGYWGAPGRPQVAWGDFSKFVAYTAKLTWFLPASTAVFLACVATVAEVVLGMMLVFGFFTRPAAYVSSVLLSLFAVAMTLSLGPKAPLDYSVFTACSAALLLATAE